MKRVTETVTYEKIVSDVLTKVSTRRLEFASAFEWADAHVLPWKVVTTKKSHAWGKHASYYGPAAASDAPDDVAMRISIFHEFATSPRLAESIFGHSARFTLEHFDDKNFRGGSFRQFARWENGQIYARASMALDYTPALLSQVLDRFQSWAEEMHQGTTHLMLGQETVRDCREAAP